MTAIDGFDVDYEVVFQFLIGKIMTDINGDVFDDQPEFQFLIGKIMTRVTKVEFGVVIVVSIPHR